MMKEKINVTFTFKNAEGGYKTEPVNRSSVFYLVDNDQKPGEVELTAEAKENHYVKVDVLHQTDKGELSFGKSVYMGRLKREIYEELSMMGFIRIEGDLDERFILLDYDTSAQSATIVEADNGPQGNYFKIRFTESGYEVLEKTCVGSGANGYLHCSEESAAYITSLCRDQMIQYFFNHNIDELPGVGRTVQRRYFAGLSTEEFEAIGNKGKKAFYAYKKDSPDR